MNNNKIKHAFSFASNYIIKQFIYKSFDIIIITNTENNIPEIYTVQRLNWKLPVVEVKGIWWTKYNLRGNAKNFNDQIQTYNDPAKGKDLAEFYK